jgi:hypothetical protein
MEDQQSDSLEDSNFATNNAILHQFQPNIQLCRTYDGIPNERLQLASLKGSLLAVSGKNSITIIDAANSSTIASCIDPGMIISKIKHFLP